MMRLSRLKSLSSKKTRIIIGGIVLALIVGGYMLWSKHAWAQYAASSTQWHQGIESDIKTLTELPVASSKDEDALLVRIKQVTQRIASDQDSVCEVNPLVKWQRQFIKGYSSAISACQKMSANITLFQKQLNVAADYMKDDQALAKIITTINPPGELAEDTWEKQATAWGEAVKAVTDLSVSQAFKPTQQRAVEKMTAVKIAWQELIAAHQLKDKAKYVDAQNKLGTTYDGLNDVSTDSKKNLTGITDSLSAAYTESFQ